MNLKIAISAAFCIALPMWLASAAFAAELNSRQLAHGTVNQTVWAEEAAFSCGWLPARLIDEHVSMARHIAFSALDRFVEDGKVSPDEASEAAADLSRPMVRLVMRSLTKYSHDELCAEYRPTWTTLAPLLDVKTNPHLGSRYLKSEKFATDRVSHCINLGVGFFDDKVSDAATIGRAVSDDCQYEIHDSIISNLTGQGHPLEEMEEVVRQVMVSMPKQAADMVLVSRANARGIR
jgi:hypothetical protein